MRALKLSKDLTLAKKAVQFLSTTVLILSTGSFSWATETGGNTYQTTIEQDREQRCYSVNDRLTDARTNLARKCSKAGLGGNVNSCLEKLEECDSEDGKDDAKCLNHSIAMDEYKEKEEREDKIREKIEDLQGELEAEIEISNEIKEKANTANAKLEETLSEITNGRADALQKEITEMENITESLAQKRDELDQLQLQLRKFIVDHEMECRKNAQSKKSDFVSAYLTRAHSGNRIKVSQKRLWSNANLSVNEQGTIRYNRYLRNCMALYTVNGKRTGYGTQFRYQQAAVNKQKQIVRRQMTRLTAQRTRVRQAKQNALDRLNGLQRAAIAAHTRSVTNLQNQLNASEAKKTRLLTSINGHQMRLGIAGSSSGSAADKIMLALGLMRAQQNSSGSERAPASQAKYDAFTDALSAASEVTIAEEANQECTSSTIHADDAARDLAGGDISDGTNAVAVGVGVDPTATHKRFDSIADCEAHNAINESQVKCDDPSNIK